MKRFALSCLLLFGICWGAHTADIAQAATSFSNTLHTTYSISAQGNTTVSHRFQIVNNTPAMYLKQYALQVNGKWELSRITATSNGQTLEPSIAKGDDFTTISIDFPDVLVGEGKKRELEITYQTKDAAVVSGQVIEVHVPSLESEEGYQNYSVTIITPTSFGKARQVTPTPEQETESGGYLNTHFVKDAQKGVTALFGDTQLFSLDLTYHLTNPTNSRAQTQLALPPDTAFQSIVWRSLDPLPTKILPDQDGNTLAYYTLEPQTTTTVVAKGQAKLQLEPLPFPAPATSFDTWLKTDEFWEKDSQQLTSLSSSLHSAKDIYQSVIDTLEYTTQDISVPLDRLGAAQSITQPSVATCQEFTDLFVGLARSSQIPARRLVGYAHTTNQNLRPLSYQGDILHAWPEYFSEAKQAWIPVDPTWGDTTKGLDYFTTFDLNHVVFAINGASSTTPYPAGSYQDVTQAPSKDVRVTFATQSEFSPPAWKASVEPRALPFSLTIPGLYDLVITNQTGRAWYDLQLQLNTPHTDNRWLTTTHSTSVILPWQSWRVPLTVYTTAGLISSTATLQLTHQDQSGQMYAHSFPLQSDSSLPNVFTHPLVLPGVVLSGVAITLLAGSLLVYGRARRSALRRKS
jgi:hypothetical protein